MKRIILLDTHAIIHRAYHALPDFKSQNGTPTGALYGLCNMISSIIRDLKPDYVFACYDLPEKTFRHVAYEEYKGKRQKTDDDLVSQIIDSREIIEALSIPIYDAPGYEADDVIGTFVHKFKSDKNFEIIIASGDMDTLQLIDKKKVRVFTLKKGITDTVLLDEDYVLNRFGFSPIYIPDYKALRGDTADNIPGVPGVGEKTAITLIQKFHTLENLYKVLNKDENEVKTAGVTDRIVKILKENEENAFFSKMLVSIREDTPIDFSLPEKEWKESFDKELAEKVFKKFEFRKMMEKFDPNYIKPEKIPEIKTKKVEQTLFSDTPKVEVSKEQKQMFEELKMMFWLLNSENTNATIEKILEATKTDSLPKAHVELSKQIKNDNKLYWLYENVEKKLFEIVDKMSKRGMLIDVDYLQGFSKKIHKDLEVLQKEIIELAGEDFNINSSKQLSQILFEKLNLNAKGVKKRKDGLSKVDAEVLIKFKGTHPIINKILEYREKEKLRSTYIDSWLSSVDDDNTLHPEFLIYGTSTGRFSSQNPNVQNIPIGGNFGEELRKSFVARDGFSLVALDYSQIELRALAILSQDESLIDIFNKKQDIHTEVASKLYGVEPQSITKDMRRHAKVVNFGILYGMGKVALSKEMGVTPTEAKDIIDTYFSRFPKVAIYLGDVLKDSRKNGFTETLFGRKRYIANIKSNVPFLRALAERMAGNAPIQGTATADLIRIALVNVWQFIKESKLEKDVFPLLQIHDELVFEIKDDVLDKVLPQIKQIMEKEIDPKFLVNKKTVPIITESHVGKNWGQMI